MASQGYTDVKTYQVVHVKQVYFIVCQLNLNKAEKSKKKEGEKDDI